MDASRVQRSREVKPIVWSTPQSLSSPVRFRNGGAKKPLSSSDIVEALANLQQNETGASPDLDTYSLVKSRLERAQLDGFTSKYFLQGRKG